LTDFGFKYIFGAKESLIDFLNAVLDIDGGIVDLTYENPERIPHSEEERKAQFDLHCTTGTGERVIIEMQNHHQEFFKDRTVYYATFPIQEQAPKGKEWDYELTPVYSVNIVNFRMDDKKLKKPEKKPDEKYVSYVQLMDIDTKEVFYQKLTFVYLELPRFDKEEHELQTGVEQWMFVLKNLPELKEIPKALQNEVFGQLFQMAEIAGLSAKLRKDYQSSLKYYRDMNNIIAYRDKQIAMWKQEATMSKQEAAMSKQEAAMFKKGYVTVKKENVTVKRKAEMSEKKAEKATKEAAMYKEENERLRRLLGLNDTQAN
jgi:predicted transposase/invertase (TIGR01784 family)